MKITAAVLREIGQPLDLMELKFADLVRGQVLIEYQFSGICRSQLMEIGGKRGEDKWLPHLLGHEGVGVVLQTGPEVETVKVGDTVVVGWLETSGIDAQPASYINIQTGEKVNSGKAVTFATHAVVSENRIFLKPKSISNRSAVLLGCALPTGAGMVLNESNPRLQDKVLIIGLGGIGLSVLVTLLMKGLSNISVIEPNEEKLALAETMGAKGFLKTSSDNLSLKNFFDLCYEASGTTHGIETGFSLINTSGTLIFASHPPNGELISIDPHQLIQGKKIIGSWGGGGNPETIAAQIEQLDHSDYLDSLLGKDYLLVEINKALEDLASGRSLRPIISMKNYG